MPRIALALLFIAAVAPACAQQAPPKQPAPPAGQVVCPAQRPQICTREYRPVCGTRRDGTRQTYGNACSACADANVVSHIPGAC